MKQTLLLLVFALGMFSDNVGAQTKKPVRKTTTQAKSKAKTIPKDSREYQVGDDGFEWYKVCKNGKYGAEDKNGNVIIPSEFNSIMHASHKKDGELEFVAGFSASLKDEGNNIYVSYYNNNGKCLIPYTRHYFLISKWTEEGFGTYYSVMKSENGRILVGVLDINGNEIFLKEGSEGRILLRNMHPNPLANNPKERIEEPGLLTSSSSNKSSSNSGIGTTTVVVEHHRDPVPVQEWQQCVACFGSGKCPNVSCGGSGWYYIGDKARTCTRCHGSGKCTICAGKGGNYITVYK